MVGKEVQYPESDLPAAQEMSIYKQCSKIGWRKSILKQLATSKPVISYVLKPRGSSKWQVSCLLCDGLQGADFKTLQEAEQCYD